MGRQHSRPGASAFYAATDFVAPRVRVLAYLYDMINSFLGDYGNSSLSGRFIRWPLLAASTIPMITSSLRRRVN